MNIFRTFDLFWSFPRKLFAEKIFRVRHIDTGISDLSERACHVDAEVSDKEVYLSVYNSPKTYSLLTSVLYKKKLLNENKDGKIHNERTLA